MGISPTHLPRARNGGQSVAFSHLGPTYEVGGGVVSLQPPACSRWMRAPAGTTPCSGTTTPRQTPAGPSSLGGAEGTATASKPSGNASGDAKPQQVRQPLSPPTLLFLQPGVRSKQEKPIHDPPTSIALWCPTRTEQGLGGMPLVCKVPPTLSSLWLPPVPLRSSWTPPPLATSAYGMQVHMWVMRRVPVGTRSGS